MLMRRFETYEEMNILMRQITTATNSQIVYERRSQLRG